MKTKAPIPDPLLASALDIHYWKLVGIDQELEQIQTEREAIELEISQSSFGIASKEEYEALEKLAEQKAFLLQAKEELLTAREVDKRLMLQELQALRQTSGISYETDLDRI